MGALERETEPPTNESPRPETHPFQGLLSHPEAYWTLFGNLHLWRLPNGFIFHFNTIHQSRTQRDRNQ